MNLSIDSKIDIINGFDFPKNLIHIANDATDGLFAILFVCCVIGISIWAMRDDSVEVQRSLTSSLLIGFIISLFFVALEEIEVAFVTTIGILFVISLIYQKQSEN